MAIAQTQPGVPSPNPAQPAEAIRPIDPYVPRPVSRSPIYSRTTAYPDSRQGYGDSDSTYGFRNPGGVGRRGEYYPPGNKFQSGGTDPIRVATFNGTSGPPGIQEQMQAQQLGVQKTNAQNANIDALARPGFGLGYGFGYGGAFGARFPY